MEEKKRLVLGQRFGNQILFTDKEKMIIIEDYLSGNKSKKEVYKRYTGRNQEHGSILSWMYKFGIKDHSTKDLNFEDMPKEKKENSSSDNFETLTLKRRIEELEKQVKTSELKAIAFSLMVDIAEKEFNIPIRKKHNTKS
jgi:transposase